ncbi:hypothetical protein GCM10027090_26680 [Sinomonas soli]
MPDGTDVDVREACLLELGPDEVVVGVPEGHPAVERRRPAREELGEGLFDEEGHLVALERAPDGRGDPGPRPEHAARLRIGPDPIREEHDPELAHHRVEGPLLERELLRVGLLPPDGVGGGEDVVGPDQHGGVEVRGGDRGAGEDPVERPRDHPRAGSGLEHARGVGGRDLGSEVVREVLEDHGHEDGVVELRDGPREG